MTICPKCNVQIEDGVSICSNCGHAINTIRPEYSMRYVDSKGRISQRNISQVLILNDSTFQCFCHLRNDQRTFSFANVVDIEPLDTGIKTNNAKELFTQRSIERLSPVAPEEKTGNDPKQEYYKAFIAALDDGHGSIDSNGRKRLDILKSSLQLSDEDVSSIEQAMDSDPGLSNMEKIELSHSMDKIIQGLSSECLEKLSQIYSNHPTKKEISSVYLRALKIEDANKCRLVAKRFSIESVLATTDLDIHEGNFFHAEKKIFEVKNYAIYGADPLLSCEEAYFYCNVASHYNDASFIEKARTAIESVPPNDDSYQIQFVNFIKQLINVLSNKAGAASLLQLPPYWQFMAKPIIQKYGPSTPEEPVSTTDNAENELREIKDIRKQQEQWSALQDDEKNAEEKRTIRVNAAKEAANQKAIQYANQRTEQAEKNKKYLEQIIQEQYEQKQKEDDQESIEKLQKEENRQKKLAEKEEKKRLVEEEKVRKEQEKLQKLQEREQKRLAAEEEKRKKQLEREQKRQEAEEQKRLAAEEKIRKQQELQRIANSVSPFYVDGEYFIKYQNKKGWRYHFKVTDIFVTNGLSFDFCIETEYNWDTGEELTTTAASAEANPFYLKRTCYFENLIEISRAETPDDKTTDALTLFKQYPGESPAEKWARQAEEEKLEREKKEQEVQKALEAIRASDSTSPADDKVFISYSRADKAVVYPLVERLQKDVGARFWVDLKGIESGSKFEEVLMQALNYSDTILFMHSENSLQSEWTKREVSYAESKKKRIIPITLNDDGLQDWASFHFGNTDFINPRIEAQYTKLVSNLKGWLGITSNDEPIT